MRLPAYALHPARTPGERHSTADHRARDRLATASPPGHLGHRPRPHQELQVRLTAQRILVTHLRLPADIEAERASSVVPFWPGIDLDLTGAVLVDWDFDRGHLHSATFTEVTFTGGAWFEGASFTGGAGFETTSFTGGARFLEARFTRGARFTHASFAREAWFGRASFAGDAWFFATSFTGGAGFERASFTGEALFEAARFTGPAGFEWASFRRPPRLGMASVSRRGSRSDRWPLGWRVVSDAEGGRLVYEEPSTEPELADDGSTT